jgi:DNA-binding response OmpR family regulator
MPSVVVADDEAEIRGMLSEFLAECGYEVLEAENGLATLVHVKRAHPDAVVLDLHMPRLSGVEALRLIREFDPAIVVAVVTGDLDASLHRRVMDMGAAAVFVKPASLSALAAALTSAIAMARPASAQHATPPAPGATVACASALVIDDDDLVRDLLCEYLGRLKYDVRQAADAIAGLREVGREVPDVILLDIGMPGLSGVDAIPRLRAVAPGTSIIMVSGTVNADDAKQALAHGAFDYITKPIDFAHLTKTLETAVLMRGVRA